MSTGFLMFPVGYAPTNDGAVVPGGKLYFSRTGTATLQDTFSDSTLGVANSNPVVLNSEGYLDTKVFGTPTTGFKYRVKLTDANDVQIWQVDDVTMGAADSYALGGVAATSFPQVQTGTFTGTLTGYASGPTGTVNYTINGTSVRLYINADITGTSNATTLTMTGLPAAVRPTGARIKTTILFNNSTSVVGGTAIAAAGSVITFTMGSPLDSAGFTNSGTKGLKAGWTIEYEL